MAKVSIIIPSRNEKYLAKTVEEAFSKARGKIEVIVVLDGPTSDPLPSPRPNLKLIKKSVPHGLRVAINMAAQKATGKYLLKTDAHCMFDIGYDLILQRDCQEDWVIVPRRHWMDSKKPRPWKVVPNKEPADYHYLTFPWSSSGLSLNTAIWYQRCRERQDVNVDETMAIHGSMWFTNTDYFLDKLGGFDTKNFGYYAEHIEIILKTWLSGGRVMVNKNTWYAHLQDVTAVDRLWPEKLSDMKASHIRIAEYWVNNQWKKQIHGFDWLIDKFWPLPLPGRHTTKDKHLWLDNWRDYYSKTPEEEIEKRWK